MFAKSILSLLLFVSSSLLAVDVKVGAYNFPPYVTEQGGLTIRFIQFLNESQQKYKFSLVETTAQNRWKDLKSKKFDLILFEDQAWGWKGSKVDVSTPFYSDAAMYVALNEADRNQTFFDNLKSKKILARRGYHYGFAKFNTDEKYLSKHFKIQLFDTPQLVLENLLMKRGDIAVITNSYLEGFIKSKPELSNKFLISNKVDQDYRLSAIIGKHSPVTKSEFNQLILNLRADGKLDQFFNTKSK